MAFRYLDIELTVQTITQRSVYRAEFSPALNVIQAPNTWGKSTLVQSLVFGLGLEGAFSTSHLSPLGEAMSSVVDLNGHREAVVESSVTLTIQNDDGLLLRTRRFAKSLTYKSDLIQTWSATLPSGLESAQRADLYVRQVGGATHELGFHRLLEDFIGLDLPQVPGFNADEVKLYLEVVLPLFYIEQKYGWSGLAPRVPTHYRIRSPYRRAAEFVLGLGTLERLRARERLNNSLASVKEEWSEANGELNLLLASQGWVLSRPLATLQESGVDSELDVGVEDESGWTSASLELERMRSQLEQLSSVEIRAASERTEIAQKELVGAEGELTRLSGTYRAKQEMLSSIKAETTALHNRRDELQHNRETLLDIRKLERLGSEIHSSALGSAHCPTCAQSLDSTSVVTGLVMDVAANLGLLDAEKATLNRLIGTETHRLALAESACEATRNSINALRIRVRGLKDELTGPSGAPSVAQIEQRLALAERIRVTENTLARTHSILETLRDRSLSIVRVREQLRILRAEGEDGEDKQTIRRFRALFTHALEKFGLRSLPVSEVTIGADSLLPEQGGFELTFDISHGLSASDAIRTKWAHYLAIAQASAEAESAHSLGILIMDEPRQQEAEHESVKALYAELSQVAGTTQVIVASSANDAEMADLLDNLPVHLIKTHGTHMFDVG